MNVKHAGVIVGLLLAASGTAHGQTPAPAPAPAATSARVPAESPWSIEFALGLDNGISGNINSGAVGRINGQAVVVTKNSYDDVYGTGLHIKFGGGYMLDQNTEVRVGFTLQSLDADLVRMGDIGTSPLYGQFSDYQSFGIDFGYRKYGTLSPKVRAYGEGTLGMAFLDETDVILVAPAYNIGGNATDFYDKTSAFTLGANAGILVQTGKQLGVFGQMGLRWVSGMSEVDGLQGTGLETINDKSARWTFPFLAGVRLSF